MTKKLEKPSYILAEGKDAHERLDFQHTFFRDKLAAAFEASSSLLDIKGAVFVDFGCGTSSIYEDILTLIGRTGKYIGIDASSEQIAFNRSRFKDAHYIVGDETSPEVMASIASADIVYMRFVVMHQRYPKEFLKKIYVAIKAQAILIIQEPENTPELKLEVEKKYPFAGDLCEVKSTIGRKLGLDYNFAKHIAPILIDFDPKTILHTTETLQLSLPQAKELFTRSIKEIHAKGSALLTSTEVAHYLEIISKLPEDENIFWSSELLHTIIVQKK